MQDFFLWKLFGCLSATFCCLFMGAAAVWTGNWALLILVASGGTFCGWCLRRLI